MQCEVQRRVSVCVFYFYFWESDVFKKELLHASQESTPVHFTHPYPTPHTSLATGKPGRYEIAPRRSIRLVFLPFDLCKVLCVCHILFPIKVLSIYLSILAVQCVEF